MCGIAGIYDREPVTPGQLSLLMRTLAKRGPDQQSIARSKFGLLIAARLRIVDIAGAGEALLTSPDSRYRIAYNGEVLNYRQLASELGGRPWQLQTARDTEVVLQSVARFGSDAASRLRGQFAFIVEDTLTGRVVAARDHFGICPLWFARRSSDGLVLASSPACLLDLGAEPSSVSALAQGHKLVWECETGTLSIAPFVESIAQAARSEAELHQLIYQTVRSKVPADVPYATIAGGLDSSLATAVCATESHRPECMITISTDLPGEQSSDVRNAELLAHTYSVPSIVQPVDEDFVVETLPLAIRDLCSASHLSVIAALMSRASAQVALSTRARVLITGGGGDEIFGGYDFVWKKFPRSLVEENLTHIRRQTGLFECHREDAAISSLGVEPRPAYYSAELDHQIARLPLLRRLPGLGEGRPIDKAILRAAAAAFPRFPAAIATAPKKALYQSTAISLLVERTARRLLPESEARRWYERRMHGTSWAYHVPRNELHTAVWIHKTFCALFPMLAGLSPRTSPPDYDDPLDYGRYHPMVGVPVLQRAAHTESLRSIRSRDEVRVLRRSSSKGLMSF